ncbi:hypothetical protein [Streptomyces fuscichromogenes]|uniref:Uncharacterized protein n=1 Tax=Streptomyces fuscichromogenes TaxID=1324013 RepID=A0A917XQQ0_9ACTN|nr:hypothetical protein [Streptomyces fuscichromogenes]GGN46305.1 hypothetical protein GCM10011578_099100 [Streptomyces fuscichromogenes]
MSVRTHPMTLSGTLADPAVLINSQAYFRLTYTPEDHNCAPEGSEHEVREAVLPCALADPEAAADLAELHSGAPLTVSGYLALPDTYTSDLRLVVHTAVVEPATQRDPGAPRPALHLVRTEAH